MFDIEYEKVDFVDSMGRDCDFECDYAQETPELKDWQTSELI